VVCQCVDGALPLTMSAQTRNGKKVDGLFSIGDGASGSNSIRPPPSTEPFNGDTGYMVWNGAPPHTSPAKSALNPRQTDEPSQKPPMPRPNELSSPDFDTQAASEDALGDRVGQTEVPSAGRKNVQFAADTQDVETMGGLPSQSSPLSEPNTDPHNRSQSFYSKLKALKTSTSTFSHSRSPSSFTINNTPTYAESEGPAIPSSTESNEPYFPQPIETNSTQADADAEESGPDRETNNILPRKRRRKSGRVNMGGIETAPASPLATRHTVLGTDSMATTEGPQPGVLARRATDTDASPLGQHGASDDDGRSQGHESPWRRRAAWRGLSYNSGQGKTNEATPTGEGRRPMTLRNFTHIGSHTDENDARPSRRRMMTERGTSLSAQKWRQIKQKIQLLGQNKKKERTVDHEKSAELLAELLAGSPAALIAASMFQRDEHGSKRIPILLEQLKVRITDSELDRYKEKDNPTPGDRHMIFRIELEYGNGVNRMKWVVKRSLRDFANLHIKYKLQYSKEKYVKLKKPDKEGMPRFPKGAFPYLRAYRGLEDEGDDDEDDGDEDTGTDNERPAHKHRHATSFLGRRKSNTPVHTTAGGPTVPGERAVATASGSIKRDTYPERQRKTLEVYLQKMIKFMLFRPDSNRLCKFLEVSALGMRLAAEGSYHGKEGFLLIRSSMGVDFRKALTPANVKSRHMPKWFLVRHSYVVCVDSPEEMHIYDVFLFDSDFKISFSKHRLKDQKAKELAQNAKENAKHPQHHRLKLQNSERKLKLLARNERQLHQFEESILSMLEISPWVKKNRYDSFAPIRPNCFAQWLVDGRDHMWLVSRAIDQARDVIYIHDWWLSPELYMRRPAAISQKWRLDRLLKRKAEQGVKIFVIIYRNVESAVPIDSQYTKFSLLELHPNVFVQRSPNQFRQNTFFWAHHEKLCIIDHTMAFVGGIDLCFGRWDTPQHSLTDDKATGFEPNDLPKDAEHCQMWAGKDYSNPRIQDFYALNKPYEEMYDRLQVARMPWHDISMQVVGQPARDLTRHFVQRWNYILRQRKPTRPTPFLLPPPDFNAADLEALGLNGTCEVQILRSAGPWSLGTPDKTEHSIMNAYAKLIEESEHFVYIENQFFISSCETEAVTIHNLIGDALVERIVRAARDNEAWRACLIIPLIPGFQNTVEEEGGTSVRLIMQYQYRSICRGDSSVFGRLRARGIEPEDYIQFYALRQWGKIGPKKILVTEQLYIHAKIMIVDDRTAIIGSANINERSMLGNRDSECAAIVKDADMILSRMNGEPYRVGRFAHTLRVRLMREHLGLDIDKIMEETQALEAERRRSSGDDVKSPNSGYDDRIPRLSRTSSTDAASPSLRDEFRQDLLRRQEEMHSFNHDIDWEQAHNPNLITNRKLTADSRVTANVAHQRDVDGEGEDHMVEIAEAGYGVGRDSVMTKDGKEVLLSGIMPEGKATACIPIKLGMVPRLPTFVAQHEAGNPPLPPRPGIARMDTAKLGMPMPSQLPALPISDDSDIGGPALAPAFLDTSSDSHHPLLAELRPCSVDRECMEDPLLDSFILDTWHAVAENNTKIYRSIFRCMPDSEVKTWAQYKEYIAYEERFKHMQGGDAIDSEKAVRRTPPGVVSKSGPPGAGINSVTMASTKAATQLRGVGGLSLEAEKKAGEIREKIGGLVNSNKDSKEAVVEKEKLRSWAADTNKAQMERQQRSLSRHNTFGAQDEKAALETVPEAGIPPSRSSDGQTTDSTTEVATGSSTSPTSVEKTPPLTFMAHSAAVNMNSQSAQTRKRRGTARSSRRTFLASDDIPSQAEAEELLNKVQGHLVLWPYDW
jgi:phospholipase D1/2